MTSKSSDNLPDFAVNGINLASAGLGARAIAVTDEFFAPLARALDPAEPVFIADRFDDSGKWMDGWETRRRRGGGHDHGTIALAARGRIAGFDVDTSHFTGNNAPACRIEACDCAGDPGEDADWVEVLPVAPLGADAHHYFAATGEGPFTHVRLHIYPDGGVARFRVFGLPEVDPARLEGKTADLAATLCGGRALAWSDAHYGDPQRILAPGRGVNMGDGWETRRRRTPGHDWIIVELGTRGVLSGALVDTAYFKGNYPESCSLQAADLSGFRGGALTEAVVVASMFWEELLPRRPLGADAEHAFDRLADLGPVTHVRLNVFPDGGISRLRLFGRPQ